jgi:hypothetical protein
MWGRFKMSHRMATTGLLGGNGFIVPPHSIKACQVITSKRDQSSEWAGSFAIGLRIRDQFGKWNNFGVMMRLGMKCVCLCFAYRRAIGWPNVIWNSEGDKADKEVITICHRIWTLTNSSFEIDRPIRSAVWSFWTQRSIVPVWPASVYRSDFEWFTISVIRRSFRV